MNAQTAKITITPIQAIGGVSNGEKIRCDAQGVPVSNIEGMKLVKVDQNNKETVYINAVGNNANWGINVPPQWKTLAKVTKQALFFEVILQPSNCAFKGKYRCILNTIDGVKYTSIDGVLNVMGK